MDKVAQESLEATLGINILKQLTWMERIRYRRVEGAVSAMYRATIYPYQSGTNGQQDDADNPSENNPQRKGLPVTLYIVTQYPTQRGFPGVLEGHNHDLTLGDKVNVYLDKRNPVVSAQQRLILRRNDGQEIPVDEGSRWERIKWYMKVS